MNKLLAALIAAAFATTGAFAADKPATTATEAKPAAAAASAVKKADKAEKKVEAKKEEAKK
jgi:hypothetical protein